MEILTKTGLTALWQKLKDSFILKKGGGTIVPVNDSMADSTNYHLKLEHNAMTFIRNNSKDVPRDTHLNYKELSIAYNYTNWKLKTLIDSLGLDVYRYNANGNITNSVSVRAETGITGDQYVLRSNDDVGFLYLKNEKGVTTNSTLQITGDGEIKVTRYDGNPSGKDTELFNRSGSYKTIGVDIAPLKDGTIPSENIPILDYVPNNKASQIKTGTAIYKITDDRLFMTKDENANSGSVGNYLDLSIPSTNGGGSFKIYNKQSNSSGDTWNSYTEILAGTIYANTSNANGSIQTSINPGRISAVTYKEPNSTSAPYNQVVAITDNTALIQITDTKSNNGKYYANGIDFDKRGYVVGANKDFYEVGTGANCLLKLNENGEIPTDVVGGYVPLKKGSEILIDDTWYYSFGSLGEFKVGKRNTNAQVAMHNDLIRLYNDNGGIVFDVQPSQTEFVHDVKVYQGDLVIYDDLKPTAHTQIQSSRIYSSIGDDNYIDIQTGGGITVKNNGSVLSGHLIGADGNYYQLNAANGVPQLDANEVITCKGVNVGHNGYFFTYGSITNGENNNNAGGEDISDVRINSWWGLSFSTNCTGSKFYNKTAIGIDCRDGNLYVGNNITAKGTISGSSTSDIRLKDNLKEADCISTINSLGDIYTFTYKDTKEDSIGLIAQNVKESSLADLVTENSEGYLGINYWSPKLVCLALGAAQQLDKRVKELEKQIEELKSK